MRADTVVVATEGYTADLPGRQRRAAPAQQRDDRHRAAAAPTPGRARLVGRRDGARRLATSTPTPSAPPTGGSPSAGGGCPIASARAPTARGRCRPQTVAAAPRAARRAVPGAAEVPVRAGVARRARRGARLVPGRRPRSRRGLGLAGGYAGEGVAASNLAARTLRDLVARRDSELTHCPGSASGARAGSPSRCASSARGASTGCTGWRTSARRTRGHGERIAGAADLIAGR